MRIPRAAETGLSHTDVAFNWMAGTLGGSVTTSIASGGTMTLSGSEARTSASNSIWQV